MIGIETLGERVEDGSICAVDCPSADALEDSARRAGPNFETKPSWEMRRKTFNEIDTLFAFYTRLH
jgi:hypothetical protein